MDEGERREISIDWIVVSLLMLPRWSSSSSLYACVSLGIVVGGITLLLLPLPCSFVTHRILPIQQQQQPTNQLIN